MKKFALTKSEKILDSKEFTRIRRQGKTYKGELLILTILKSPIGRHRVGISISAKKIKLATRRNHLRRLIKDSFRFLKVRIKNGSFDQVYIVRKAPEKRLTFSYIDNSIQELLKKAGIL